MARRRAMRPPCVACARAEVAGHRLPPRRRQHAARQRPGRRRPAAPPRAARSGTSASSATGRSSRSCAPSSATPTTWARSSATGSRTRATRTCSRSRRSSSNYPFANRLYPELARRDRSRPKQWGRRSSSRTATSSSSRARSSARASSRRSSGNVLIYIHKEQELDDVERRYPGRPLRAWSTTSSASSTAIKQVWGDAGDDGLPAAGPLRARPRGRWRSYPPADVTVERIGELVDYDLGHVLDG